MSPEEKLQRNQFVHELSIEYARKMIDRYIEREENYKDKVDAGDNDLLNKMKDYYNAASLRFYRMFSDVDQELKRK